MIEKCANPACGKVLHYLRDGRIFVFEVNDSRVGNGLGSGWRLKHLWLCGACSRMFTIRVIGRQIRLVALPTAHDTQGSPAGQESSANQTPEALGESTCVARRV